MCIRDRIVERHFWLFGEQYNLASADQRMQKALEQYRNYIPCNRDLKNVIDDKIPGENHQQQKSCYGDHKFRIEMRLQLGWGISPVDADPDAVGIGIACLLYTSLYIVEVLHLDKVVVPILGTTRTMQIFSVLWCEVFGVILNPTTLAKQSSHGHFCPRLKQSRESGDFAGIF